jgi:hypothetical protein
MWRRNVMSKNKRGSVNDLISMINQQFGGSFRPSMLGFNTEQAAAFLSGARASMSMQQGPRESSKKSAMLQSNSAGIPLATLGENPNKTENPTGKF